MRRDESMLLMPRERVQLTRDIIAVEIPSGTPRPLERGLWVTITQSLGGSFTVLTDTGYQARVDGRDADALGKQLETAPAPASPADPALGATLQVRVLEA